MQKPERRSVASQDGWDETVYGFEGEVMWRIAGCDVSVGPSGSAFIFGHHLLRAAPVQRSV